ncbi:MAG: PDZ domain-containing protein [Gemmatimonadaceae bacterium]|nr:PDZ domain-containing protein [Gemmatimonadaceae bacterium]
MRVILSIIAGGATLGLAAGLGAQQPRSPAPGKEPAPMRVPAPDGENCVTTGGRTECRIIRRIGPDSALMKRAALGIQLTATGSVRDTIGVFVARVTPKGPAENAGIVEGDRIVSVNGVDLRVNAADAGDAYASGLPSRRLTREVAKLSPGAVVNLRVSSGGRVRDVQVTAGRASDLREPGPFGYFFDGPGAMTLRGMPDMEHMRMPMMQLRGMPHMRMEEMQLPRMQLDGMRDHIRIEVKTENDKAKTQKK